MALGFQDCCNLSSYFYLNGIPATVSQNEFYHIITLEGPAFCATYTNIPALNYQPPTYTLDMMTEYTSCDTCFAGASLTCPSDETIFLSQFGPGSISVGTDCSIRTLSPLIVDCVSTNPSFDGFADGVVSVFVVGGTPPYSFFNPDNGVAYGAELPIINNTYSLIIGALEGEYPIQVVDANQDFVVNVTCVLQSPPTILTLVANGTNVTIFGVCDGIITISVTNGTPPYQIYVNGVLTTETTLTDLCADVYEITVIDSGVDLDQQTTSTTVTITEPGAIVYPAKICLTIDGCGTTFNLTFTRTGDYNNRANYVCDNPQDLGLTQLILRWENGWTTTLETSDGNIDFDVPCPNISSLNIQFVKSSPQTAQPTGNWQSSLGIFQGETGSVSVGPCAVINPPPPPPPPSQPTLKPPTISDAPCVGQPGSVILEGQGGAGFPYTYYINGVVQASSTISLPAGTYSATVSDSAGTTSISYTFTIGTTLASNINIVLSTSVDTTIDAYTEVNGSNPPGCPGCGIKQSYHPVKTVVTVTGIDPTPFNAGGFLAYQPGVGTLYGYFLVTIKKQSAFNEYYQPTYQVQPESQEILLNQIGDPFGVPAPATYYGPQPIINIPDETFTFTTSSLVVTQALRPLAINTNFIPAAETNSCPDDGFTISRTLVQGMQIGSPANPIPLTGVHTDDGVTWVFKPLIFYIPIQNKFRPGEYSGCQSAVGVEIDVQFVKTSADDPCVSVTFNGGNLNSVYRASAIQTENQDFLPHTYTNNGTIING